ncbi:hypothetical protein [Novosphingobium subterraneum]|uniref:hypothetical protein n=1 Tax=Novosphingobium subterraneum TaxID=48936 RepID=UPI000AB93EA4|nr:hypothetical protein [Novosphingobium subterraneum]
MTLSENDHVPPAFPAAAAILSLLLAATLWLPTMDAGSAPFALADGPVMATYQLPLAA